MRTKKAR